MDEDIEVVSKFYDLMKRLRYNCRTAVTDMDLTLTIELRNGVDLKFDFDADDKLIGVRED